MAEKKAAKKSSSAKKAAPAKKATGAKKAATKKAGAKKAASSAKKPAAPKKGRPAHGDIAQRAYYIHERQGGDSVENWLQAERELSDE